ncbi:MAG TPA: FMN-binding protein [Tissierellaceae bacterium]|nr:FMN-binding protein [Tissierellaceae bacterium]
MKKHISMIMILVLLATALVGCGGDSYEDGTYEGEAEGHNGPLKVSVTVEDGEIADVDVIEHEETEDLSEPALEEVPEAIVEKNSTDVDGISGVTVTSDAIKEAVDNALEGN